MYKCPTLYIVVPCYNEEQVLPITSQILFDYENGHTFIKSIYYPEGSRHGIYLYVTQGIWVAALLLATGGWNSKMREDCTLAHLTIIGIILFLLIFEMRSRYLIPFLPIFSAAAVFGLEGYVTMKEIRRKTL